MSNYNVDYSGLSTAASLSSGINSTLDTLCQSINSAFSGLYGGDTFAGGIADDASTCINELSKSFNSCAANFDTISGIFTSFNQNYQDTDEMCEKIVSLASSNGYDLKAVSSFGFSSGGQITLDDDFIFAQGGSKWKNMRTADNGNTFGAAGCCFCSLASLLCVVTGNNKYTPKWVNEQMKKLGANGSRYTYAKKMAESLGIDYYCVNGSNSSDVDKVWNDLSTGCCAAQIRIKKGGKIGGRTTNGGHYVEGSKTRVKDGKKQILIYDSAGGKSYWADWKSIVKNLNCNGTSITVMKA